MNWLGYSVDQWEVDVRGLDLSASLIRETYFFSPELLSEDFDSARGPAEITARDRTYHQAYLETIKSATPLFRYKGDFVNPELLIPFPISRDSLRLIKTID